jgi:hypothetical protein
MLKARFSWTPSISPEVVAQELKVYEVGAVSTVIANESVPADLLEFTIDVKKGSEYIVEIVAVDDQDLRSEKLAARMQIPLLPPEPPTNFQWELLRVNPNINPTA